MASDLKVGELVWAKMKGYPPWPAKVCEAAGIFLEKYPKPKTLAKKSQLVFFFGTRNFSWIEDGNLKNYADNKKLVESSKSGGFKKALAEIEDFITTGETEVPEEGAVREESEYYQSLDSSEFAVPAVPTKGKPGRKKKIVETNGDSLEDGHTAVPKKRKTLDDGKGENAGPSRLNSRKSAAHNLVNRIHGEISTAPKRKKESSLTPYKRIKQVQSATKIKRGPGRPPKRRRKHFINVPFTPPVRQFLKVLYLQKPVDVTSISKELKDKNIVPSNLKFGFLGVGIMGSGMIKNLLNSGHQVSIWNRSPEKCEPFAEIGATHLMTPSDIVMASDITFSCVADPQAAKEMVFGNCGVLSEMDATKNYVEMTSMDPESSQDIGEAIQGKGGRYLEAQLQGSLDQALNGNLIIVAAGNKSLFDECETAFKAISKSTFYVGPTGSACKVNLVLQMLAGIHVAGAAEAFILADRIGLDLKDVYSILKETSLASPLLLEKGDCMVNDKLETKFPLTHMQKDINLAVQLGHSCDQSLPIAAAANEAYKHAKRLGYSAGDVASVFYHNRF